MSLQCLLFLLLLHCTRFSQTASSSSKTLCIEAERQALMSIKNSLRWVENSTDGDILSSWKNEDYECCNWVGIGCTDGSSRHVVRLDLSPATIGITSGSLRASMISPSLFELRHLDYLDLSYIDFGGLRFPASIANLTQLTHLALASTMLSGSVPNAFTNMTALKHLDLSGNMLEGVISQAHFTNLSELSFLNLSLNSLSLNFTSNWIPPFHLDQIYLRSCKLGPQFPTWLRTQEIFSILDISDCGISDSIPDWFWSVSSNFIFIDLSKNQLNGEINGNLPPLPVILPSIDLSSNRLTGSVPSFLLKAYVLDLSLNNFSKLDLKCNASIGLTMLKFLDISDNELSGELQDCWSHFQILEIISLSNNKLSGKIPPSLGSLTGLKSLKLNNNNFTGDIPSALKNCTELLAIDFGENHLSGIIPTWTGIRFSNLNILILRSNQFSGTVPRSLCYLLRLQILDLSWNTITGNIPNCVANFTAMSTKGGYELFASDIGGTGNFQIRIADQSSSVTKSYREKATLQWKGQIREFKSTLSLVKSIDLSSNELNGEIPSEIVELSDLVYLNLSRNDLGGKIPYEIGGMKSLDALDLSWNHFVGQIPSSLNQIDRLSALDLSYNDLSGEIPKGTQIQSFPDAFAGNLELCGDPLSKKCFETEHTVVPTVSDGESDEILSKGFYISLALGFVIAFWGVCGALIFKKSFRYAYFKLVNDVGDRVFVLTEIHKNKLMRMIKS